jgi:hypothetical protein
MPEKTLLPDIDYDQLQPLQLIAQNGYLLHLRDFYKNSGEREAFTIIKERIEIINKVMFERNVALEPLSTIAERARLLPKATDRPIPPPRELPQETRPRKGRKR